MNATKDTKKFEMQSAAKYIFKIASGVRAQPVRWLLVSCAAPRRNYFMLLGERKGREYRVTSLYLRFIVMFSGKVVKERQ